jgi:hypothetical protein
VDWTRHSLHYGERLQAEARQGKAEIKTERKEVRGHDEIDHAFHRPHSRHDLRCLPVSGPNPYRRPYGGPNARNPFHSAEQPGTDDRPGPGEGRRSRPPPPHRRCQPEAGPAPARPRPRASEQSLPLRRCSLEPRPTRALPRLPTWGRSSPLRRCQPEPRPTQARPRPRTPDRLERLSALRSKWPTGPRLHSLSPRPRCCRKPVGARPAAGLRDRCASLRTSRPSRSRRSRGCG